MARKEPQHKVDSGKARDGRKENPQANLGPNSGGVIHDGVISRKGGSTGDGGNGHEKSETGCSYACEAKSEADTDANAGSTDAGDKRDGLTKPDEEAALQRDFV